MEMKVPNQINELNGSGPAAGNSVGTGRASGTAPAATGTSAPVTSESDGADVHITDAASTLASLEPSLQSGSAIDPARVAAIRSVIEQGQYTIDPEHIAGQLVQMEQALGGLRNSPHLTPSDSDAESGS
jgi:negative regulator of flagellin synthesis FlgM